MLNCVKQANRKVEGREQIDPIIAYQESFADPEDLVIDVLSSMAPQTQGN